MDCVVQAIKIPSNWGQALANLRSLKLGFLSYFAFRTKFYPQHLYLWELVCYFMLYFMEISEMHIINLNIYSSMKELICLLYHVKNSSSLGVQDKY